ncbi:MAG: competence protein ComEC family protein [Chitinophagales bacterium]|nr:competence protein ComEC family protein [Chitinophagales bacterium]MDW8427396.1 ComEC/Rec2 family competence protein [Chitinophagales bacterium]
MNYWATVPLVRPIIALVTGILLYVGAGIALPPLVAFLLVAVAILIHMAMLRRPIQRFSFLPWLGLAIHLSAVGCGNLIAQLADDRRHPYYFQRHLFQADAALIHITEPPVMRATTIVTTGEVMALYRQAAWIRTTGRTQIILDRDSNAERLTYGQYIVIKNRFKVPEGARNPMAFNYRKYLSAQEIYLIARLKQQDWHALPFSHQHALWKLIYDLRNKALHAVERYVPWPREASVIQALSVGYRANMEFELKQAYADVGVIHILAVSGMHVGILYASLLMLLRVFGQRWWGRLVQAGVVLLVIWLFALICGMPASVWRASTMFSLLLLGKLSQRNINPFNLLAASALIILLLEPCTIMDVGLQLSYAAVGGIFLLYAELNRLLARTSKLTDYVWKTTSVTLAAQVGTLPLTLHHFHQFPLLFVLANIVVIPLAALLLHLSLLLILLEPIPVLAPMLGQAAQLTAWLLNEFIYSLSLLPASVWVIPHFSFAETLLITMAAIAFISFMHVKKGKWMIAALVCVALTAAISTARALNRYRTNEIIVYSLRKKSCIDFNMGRHILRLQSAAPALASDEYYLAKIHRLQARSAPEMLSLEQFHLLSGYRYGLAFHQGFIQHPGITGLVVTPYQKLPQLKALPDLDFLIVAGVQDQELLAPLQRLNPKVIVADGNVSLPVLRALKQWCRQQHIDFLHTRHQAVRVRLSPTESIFATHL